MGRQVFHKTFKTIRLSRKYIHTLRWNLFTHTNHTWKENFYSVNMTIKKHLVLEKLTERKFQSLMTFFHCCKSWIKYNFLVRFTFSHTVIRSTGFHLSASKDSRSMREELAANIYFVYEHSLKVTVQVALLSRSNYTLGLIKIRKSNL